MSGYKDSILELVKSASTDLPKDVKDVISKFASKEKEGSPSRYAMQIIDENIKLAKDKEQPICQDTGSILFFVKAPISFDQNAFIKDAQEAVVLATENGYLRQNSVDPLNGKNSGNNLGPGSPYFHFEQHDSDEVEVKLILKGGGCENIGTQYSLPNIKLDAGRNIEGVKKCILDAVLQAQGKGCAPGILGVTIGGDRATAYIQTKEQLLRKLDDTNPNKELAEIEKEILEKVNNLGIGPMGFGGSTTLLGCKIGFLNRLPASFFVTVSYMCWAFRRQGIVIDKNGRVKEWLY